MAIAIKFLVLLLEFILAMFFAASTLWFYNATTEGQFTKPVKYVYTVLFALATLMTLAQFLKTMWR